MSDKKISELQIIPEIKDEDFIQIIDDSESDVSLKNKRVLAPLLRDYLTQPVGTVHSQTIGSGDWVDNLDGTWSFDISHALNDNKLFVVAYDITGVNPVKIELSEYVGTSSTVFTVTRNTNTDTFVILSTGGVGLSNGSGGSGSFNGSFIIKFVTSTPTTIPSGEAHFNTVDSKFYLSVQDLKGNTNHEIIIGKLDASSGLHLSITSGQWDQVNDNLAFGEVTSNDGIVHPSFIECTADWGTPPSSTYLENDEIEIELTPYLGKKYVNGTTRTETGNFTVSNDGGNTILVDSATDVTVTVDIGAGTDLKDILFVKMNTGDILISSGTATVNIAPNKSAVVGTQYNIAFLKEISTDVFIWSGETN